MKFAASLIYGTLIQRYKRFLADVRLNDGQVVTAHTANTGSMLGCAEPGFGVWLSHHPDPKRKTQYTWELTENAQGTCIGINTARPMQLVQEVLQNLDATLGIPANSPLNHQAWCFFQGYNQLQTEVKYGQENSRIDFLLSGHAQQADIYIEVKNVTLVENNTAMFPDAKSLRAQKHMRELAHMVQQGQQAAVIFVVQRADANAFTPANHIDPAYGQALNHAQQAGVQIFVWQFAPSPTGIEFIGSLPWQLAS